MDCSEGGWERPYWQTDWLGGFPWDAPRYCSTDPQLELAMRSQLCVRILPDKFVQRKSYSTMICSSVQLSSSGEQLPCQLCLVPRKTKFICVDCSKPHPSTPCREHVSAGFSSRHWPGRVRTQPQYLSLTHFLSFSSSCCLSFSRSIMDSCVNFRSPSSFLLALSRSMRIFFSCSRELSSWRMKGDRLGRERSPGSH